MAIKLFISYSRKDKTAIEIAKRLDTWGKSTERNELIWYDHKIQPSKEWWNEILSHIQACSHFIFLLSHNSLDSKFCISERAWAYELQRQIIDVKIDEAVNEIVLDRRIADFQIIPYRENIQDYINEIILAVENDPVRGDLPRPIPPRPERPKTPLEKFVTLIEQEIMSEEVVNNTIDELWKHTKDPDLISSVIFLLRQLRKKKYAENQIWKIDELIKMYDSSGIKSRKKSTTDSTSTRITNSTPVKEVSESPETIRIVLEAAKPQSPELFIELSTKIEKCLTRNNIQQTERLNILLELLFASPINISMIGLASELVRNEQLLERIILSTNDSFPGLGVCVFNECKNFASRQRKITEQNNLPSITVGA